MLNFGLFSWKSARKTGLLVLSLLLAAAPRAWGGFTITNSAGDDVSSNYLGDDDSVLTISNLSEELVISGEGKKIEVSGSDVDLTLRELTVSADSGPAFKLNAGDGNANIKIDGTVTISGGIINDTSNQWRYAFWILSNNGFVVLNAVSENSILKAIGQGIHGLFFGGTNNKGTLLLQGDGEFYCASGIDYNAGLACYGDLYVGGSVTLSATGNPGGEENARVTLYAKGSFTLFENAKVINDSGIWAEKGSVNVMGLASIAEGTKVKEGNGSSQVFFNLKRIKVQPPGLYLLSADSGQGDYCVATELTGWGKGWFTGA
ncbi:MAG: hypothetical protein LBO82_07885, partial [Synergistaceae bacterium]|nr:hypothetical protein [Synergistaceae bacterium]